MTDTPTAVDHPSTGRRILDWTAVLFPLAVSIAANFGWAARDGDRIAIVAGVVTPVLLVLAVERWHAHGGLEGWQWWTRLAAMVAVTGVTAAISWVHTTRLLLAHSWEPPLAVIAPLGVDGLAVLGTLALWPAATRAVAEVVPRVPERAVEVVDPEPDEFDQKPIGPVHGPATLVEDLRARPSLPSVRKLMDEQGLTRHAAQKALTEARTGLSVVSA